MEKFRLTSWAATGALSLLLVTAGCSSSFLKYDKEELLNKNDEFAEAVKIENPTEATALPPATELAQKEAAASDNKPKKKTRKKVIAKTKAKKSKKAAKAEPAPEVPPVRQPDLEDAEGFPPGQRRPYVDPFHVGEVVTHDVTYLGMTAGEMKMKVEPFQTVNNRKSYAFAIELKTASIFDHFYKVEDRAETLVDFDDLMPRVFSLHVKESGQLREARSYFDADKLRATYWEKKVTKKSGVEEKKQQWDILPFSQNVYSAIFYMRLFKWDVGKEYAFAVADDEKMLIFKGTAVRKEVLSTPMGDMKAIVIKPTITTKGVFTPMGDIFIWLSDDDHKYVLRIEAAIKIGTLVSKVSSIEPGQP